MARQMRDPQGPKFIRYFDSVIRALKTLGGSGRTKQVVELVAQIKGVTEADQNELLASGVSRFYTEVNFARQYLFWAGYVDSSRRGIWSLTEKGLATSEITDAEALRLFNACYARLGR